MRGSTSTPTQDDQSFLQECLDLQTLIAHTERLLHSGRQITPLAAAQMAATRQAREQRAARRAARQGA